MNSEQILLAVKSEVDYETIVRCIGQTFRTFGGDRPHDGNPIAAALQGQRLQFAAGVDVEQVVLCVLCAYVAMREKREVQ